uniref:Uncharacterized protein n=1 Tax=Oryza glumipatula TaxID=40148 RepID=A0A0D9ZTP7_9ORYZ
MSVWFSHFLLPNTTIDQTFHLAAQPRRPIHVAPPHWPSPLALVGQTLKPTQPTNSRTCSASRSTRAHHSIPSKCKKKKKKIQIGGEPAMSRGGGGGGVEGAGAGAGEAAMAPNSKAQRQSVINDIWSTMEYDKILGMLNTTLSFVTLEIS